MHEIIRFHKVDFSYERTLILKDISFTVYPGEFIHIIGPNGGGKTTLLKLLMGFIKPASGTLTINGKNPSETQNTIAYVPQVFAFDKLFPVSVFEVVLSGCLSHLPWHGKYSDEDKKRATEALEEVDMLPYKDKPIGELSGGQVQRVLIARALASHPQILLLDEPTSCVDHSANLAIDQILLKLKRRLTIMMVTHDLDHIGKNSDRVFCIHGNFSELNPNEVCQHTSMGLYPEKEEVAL